MTNSLPVSALAKVVSAQRARASVQAVSVESHVLPLQARRPL